MSFQLWTPYYTGSKQKKNEEFLNHSKFIEKIVSLLYLSK
jgi:hypothetical protein